MKAIFFSIACCFIVATATAQQDSTNNKKPVVPPSEERYCVVLKEQAPEVTINGKPIKTDIELRNGSKITPNGTVIRIDGTIQMIKPGSCVNSEGNETEQAGGNK